MSAMGYGSSYMPSWRGNIQAQNNMNQNPVFGISPEMPRPNFQPVADAPWQDPATQAVGTWRVEKDKSSWRNPMQTGYEGEGRYMAQDAWRNPLDAMFGNSPMNPINGMVDESQLGKQNALGADYNARIANAQGTPIYGFREGGNVNGGDVPMQIQIGTKYDFSPTPGTDKYGNPLAGPTGKTPLNTKELYDQIGGLTLDQMMRLSGGGNTLMDKFSATASAYKNAYANPNYGKRQAYQQEQGFGGNSLSEGETMDWLQKAYGSTLTRMNNNYLL